MSDVTEKLPPTPWQTGVYDPRYVFDAHGQEVVFAAMHYDTGVPLAKFIAKAPQMYALCEAVASLWSDSPGPDRNELIAIMKQAQELVDSVRGDDE